MASCLVLFKSKWTIMMSFSLHFLSGCVAHPQAPLTLQSALSSIDSTECVFSVILCQSMLLYALLPEGSQEWRKSSGSSGPYNLHNGKTNGRIRLLGLTDKKGCGSEMGPGWIALSRTPGGYRRLEERCLAALLSIRPAAPGGPSQQSMALLEARLKYGGLSTGLEESCAVVVAPWILTPTNGLSPGSFVPCFFSYLADKAVYSLLWLKGYGTFFCIKSLEHFVFHTLEWKAVNSCKFKQGCSWVVIYWVCFKAVQYFMPDECLMASVVGSSAPPVLEIGSARPSWLKWMVLWKCWASRSWADSNIDKLLPPSDLTPRGIPGFAQGCLCDLERSEWNLQRRKPCGVRCHD